MSNREVQGAFEHWNAGRLQSFLVEITADILAREDELGSGDLLDKILDKAKQKGTGKWTSQNAMDLGIPVPSIDIAVTMRELSALKTNRVAAEKIYGRPEPRTMEIGPLKNMAEEALYFAFVVTYAQGLHQLAEASEEYGYDLDLGTIAKIWRAGCIIRAGLLADIAQAYREEPSLPNLLLHPSFARDIKKTLSSVRTLVSYGAENGIPLPGLSNSLAYFDAYTTGRLPLNLIQAQRDYFGSHTYERTDREGTFHTDWEE
jgi:6-phosphogluconate dehydrogenase